MHLSNEDLEGLNSMGTRLAESGKWDRLDLLRKAFPEWDMPTTDRLKEIADDAHVRMGHIHLIGTCSCTRCVRTYTEVWR